VDGELEDKLNDFSLDEEHELLKLYELHGSLELAIQLELQTLLNDEDWLKHEQLLDWLLSDSDLEEQLLDLLEEQLILLLLIELLQTLKLIELPEEQEQGCDDDKGLL